MYVDPQGILLPLFRILTDEPQTVEQLAPRVAPNMQSGTVALWLDLLESEGEVRQQDGGWVRAHPARAYYKDSYEGAEMAHTP